MSKESTEGSRKNGYSRCRRVLASEGLSVRRDAKGPHGSPVPDLVAANRAHLMNVFVVHDDEIDAERTRSRIAASVRHVETRVFVNWRLRWRMISNLERWGIGGVAVDSL